MPVSYRRTTDDAWRRLRALRSSPPDNAGRGARRDLFSAALEQAEQFFRAADAVGYETKPVLLYYGLSQASQAILAARRSTRDEKEPATSHGIDCPTIAQNLSVTDLELCNTTAALGSFSMLARTLGSPTLPGRVPLRQLWISLPEGVELPPTGSSKLFGAVRLERVDGQKFEHQFQNTAGRVVKLSHLPFLVAPIDLAQVDQHIAARYPTLLNFRAIGDTRQCPEVAQWVQLLDPPGLRISLSYDRGNMPMSQTDRFGMANLGPPVYADPTGPHQWILPTLPGNSSALHPLLTWYAVLFGLSELARYRPTAWATAININTSPDATALEHLMDTAHLACVNLIAGLFAVDHPSPDGPDEIDEWRERVHNYLQAQAGGA